MSDSTSIASLPNAVVNEPQQVQQIGNNNVKLEVKGTYFKSSTNI